MDKNIKPSVIESVPFWVMAGISIALGVASFFMPPKGVIDPSVIRLTSWIFAFNALWVAFVAMIRGIDTRFRHGKTELALGDLNSDKPEGSQEEGQDENH